MPRYIDLEAFAERIKKYIKPETKEEKDLIEWCKDECIRQGYCMPTADVVPKSEVERWRRQLEAVLEEIPETKRELAREIFELIECAFSPVLVYNGYTIKEYLAELKKKRMEEVT